MYEIITNQISLHLQRTFDNLFLPNVQLTGHLLPFVRMVICFHFDFKTKIWLVMSTLQLECPFRWTSLHVKKKKNALAGRGIFEAFVIMRRGLNTSLYLPVLTLLTLGRRLCQVSSPPSITFTNNVCFTYFTTAS